jgi:hypothetical protein
MSADAVALVEVEGFEVVFLVVLVVRLGGGVEVGVAQGVGAFVPVEPVGPFAVLGDGDGAGGGAFVDGDAFHSLVVDEEVAAVVAGEVKVVVFVAEDDVDDLAGVL